MAHQVIIDSDSVLSRFKVVNRVGPSGLGVRSVHGLAMHVILCQEGRKELARLISKDRNLQRNPCVIRENAASKGFTLSANWLFNIHAIYKDILLYEAASVGSPIRAELDEIRAEANGRSCQFIVSSARRELVFSSGLRPNEIPDSPGLPGFNIYGSIVQDVYEQHVNGRYVPRWGLESLLGVNPKIPLPDNPQKTVLLISDSQSKFLQGIDSGDYFSIRGGTYEDLSGGVYMCNFDVRNYTYVIVSCGVNVAWLPFEEQQRNWNTLMERLEPLQSAEQRKRVLINTAVPHPNAEGVDEHNRWIKQQATAAGFKCINWSTRSDSPFWQDGELNPDMFEDSDNFHYSHNGFRELWKAWCSYFPNLRYVSYTVKRQYGPGYIKNKWIPRQFARCS